MPRVQKKVAKPKVAAPKAAAPKSKYDQAWKAAQAIGAAAGPLGSLGVTGARGLASLFGYGAYRYRKGGGKMKGGSMFKSRTIRGRGDYNVGGGGPVAGVPQFSNWSAGANGSVRFQHREYLQDLTSSTGFTNVQYPLNPGLASSFPFLSAIASNFEKYRWHGLSFYSRTMSGTAVGSTSTALGTIIMATQYNANASAFQNKAEMENAQGAVSGAPCYDLMHGVECAPKDTPIERLYVRTGGVPSGQDQRLFDLGLTNIAVVGCQSAANNVISELWVTYDVELIQPKVPTGAGLNLALTDHFQLDSKTMTSAAPLGTGVVAPVSTSTIQGSLFGTGTSYKFPANFTDGQFLVFYQALGASTALTTQPALTLGTNLSLLSLIASDGNQYARNPSSTTTNTAWLLAFVQFNGGTASGQSFIQFSGSPTLPTSLTSGDLFITTIAPGLLTAGASKFEQGERALVAKIKSDLRAEMFAMLKDAGIDSKALAFPVEETKESIEDVEAEIARLLAKRKTLKPDDDFQRVERVSEPTTPADFKKTMSRKA